MIVVSRFTVTEADCSAFQGHAQDALVALSQRPGFVRGRLGRAVDDPTTWVIVSEWDSVGSYRRGLSAYDVKIATAPLMVHSVPEAGAFEVVAACDEAQQPVAAPGDRAR